MHCASCHELLSEERPQNLVALLRQVLMRFRHTVRRQTAPLGLHRAQSAVLMTLWRGEGLTQSELAEKLEVSPSTMTAGLQRLEHSGLIRREQDAHDQRVSRVYVTDQGRDMRVSIEECMNTLDAQILRGFDEIETAQLTDFLWRIRKNLEDCPCPQRHHGENVAD